jgi:kumamolisin
MYQRRHERSPRALDKRYRFVRLPIAFDVEPLVREVEAARLDWLPGQWKWHIRTEFCILRGGRTKSAPGSELTSGTGVDTKALDRLPHIRSFLETAFPSPAAVAWIGLSPPGSRIFLHVDNTAHWDEHHRIHVPLITTPAARLCVDGGFLHMPLGTAWVLNNSVPHAAMNLGPARLHLVLDMPGTPAIEALIAGGDWQRGDPDPAALAELSRDPMTALTDAERRDPSLMARLRLQ